LPRLSGSANRTGFLEGNGHRLCDARANENYPKDFSLQVLIVDSRGLIIRFVFNKAKGGDPMSHGSAEGSVQFVREMKA